MKRDFSDELSPEVREKMKKNLLYVGIFSIVMMFAGFTSAYIVSMGDSFWLKYPMPIAFWISTAIIVLSSFAIELGIKRIKSGDLKGLKIMMAVTFLSGIGFVYFQFKGYGQLVDFGAHAVNNHIIVTDGRYGDYYDIKINNDFLEVDGNKFMIGGTELSETKMKDLQNFMAQFEGAKPGKDPVVKNYGAKYKLYYKQQPLGLIGGKLSTPDGQKLQYTDLLRLSHLAVNIRDKRGDFFVRGEYGKDFKLYYKGKELEYVNRELRMNGKKLSKYLQIKAMDTADSATSYLYIITFLHLLHILVTMIYMAKITIGSFTGKYTTENNLSLRLGAIFWHFLGLLWIYLLLFLLFIH
jgi:cytochrome c oxidase subunit 3